MGKAFLVPGADFSSENLGVVTLTETKPLESITIIGPSIVNVTAKFRASLTPVFTTQRAVTWSVVSGSSYAEISQDGTLVGFPGSGQQSITIRCTSNANSSIYADKTIALTVYEVVYKDYITTDGTDFVVMPGLGDIWNATVTVRLTLGGPETYSFQCCYASNSTQAKISSYNNSSNKASAYIGTGGHPNYVTKTNIIYRYVWNLGTSGGTDSSFYLYDDSNNTVLGSNDGIRITMSGLVWIFQWGYGASSQTLPTVEATALTPAGAKFYGLTVVDGSNNVLAEYKPCTYDGMPGIYDTVSGIFRGGYFNTGGITAGNDE